MKVLIVDDEKHVREAVNLLVDWERFGIDTVLEAENGQKAMELIEQESPELIFTDMVMPEKDGVELLKWIESRAPESKAIVISGYDDFQLVRHTLQYGGLDYILKPIDPDQLIEAVEKAVNSWKEDEQRRVRALERNIEMNLFRPVYRDQAFTNLLKDPSAYPAIRDAVCREFRLDGTEPCRVAVVCLDTMNEEVARKFAERRDLLFFSLTNICNEFLASGRRGYAFRNGNRDDELVMVVWKQIHDLPELAEKLNEAFQGTLGGKFDIAISSGKTFPDGLPEAWREAERLLNARNLLDGRTWIHAGNGPERPPHPLHFSEWEDRIRLALRSRSFSRMEEVVREWTDAVREKGTLTPEMLDMWYDEYRLFAGRWLEESSADDDDRPEPLPPFRELVRPGEKKGTFSLDGWRRQLLSHFLELSLLLDKKENKGKNVIYDIAEYIRSHYQDNLTLQDIADRFFVSREYISRRFKQEFNENLSDYLTRIRIEKAKLLLMNPRLKVTRIAELVGYRDEKYFSKVFKKWEGCSPNEYRKQHRSR